MRIAVDARELGGKPTGVGRYLTELLEEWAGLHSATRHDWRLYAHQAVQVPDAFEDALRVLPGNGGTLWEQWTLARALASDRPDVLFAPGYTAPLSTPCPVALTVHDVSFIAHPEWYSPREGFRRRHVTAMAARRARLVLTDSAFSRDEIARHLGLRPPRVRVIHLGLRTANDRAAAPAREPLVLFVGTILPRRHVDLLVDAFATRIAPALPSVRLAVVGEDRMGGGHGFDARLARLPAGVRSRIALTSYVDDGALRDLYSRASTFVFLSEYEGFGLTPLEALAAGVPPIVMDTPVAREIYGPAARYVPPPPDTAVHLEMAVLDLLTSPAARQDVLRHASAVVGRYRWELTAATTLRAIEEAGGAL
ncbi:MAG: glycosyltransferase family 1 protein [Acidobacteriota bacterium]